MPPSKLWKKTAKSKSVNSTPLIHYFAIFTNKVIEFWFFVEIFWAGKWYQWSQKNQGHLLIFKQAGNVPNRRSPYGWKYPWGPLFEYHKVRQCMGASLFVLTGEGLEKLKLDVFWNLWLKKTLYITCYTNETVSRIKVFLGGRGGWYNHRNTPKTRNLPKNLKIGQFSWKLTSSWKRFGHTWSAARIYGSRILSYPVDLDHRGLLEYQSVWVGV